MKKLVALPGVALFFLSCALVRGGLFDDARYGDAAYYGHYAHEMATGKWPYRDFYDEYPVLAQPLFYVVHLLPGPFVSSFKWTHGHVRRRGARADGRRDARAAAPDRSRRRRGRGVAAARRADLPQHVRHVSRAPHDRGGARLLHDRERTAYVLLALAVAAKVYPVVIVPIVLVETWDRGGRDAVRRAFAWFFGVLVLVHLPFAIDGARRASVQLLDPAQAGLEVESLGGAIVLVLDRLGLYTATLRDQAPGSKDAVGTLPDLLSVLSTFVVIVAVAWITWLYVRGRRDRVLAAAAAVTAFVAFGKVLSPQYVVWLVPLVPAAGLAASGVLVSVLVLTHAEWNHFVKSYAHWGDVLSWWVMARDLVLVVLFVLLALRLRAGPRSRSLR